MNTIAIIGSGWVGIGCLRMLSKKENNIDLFERNDEIGGVWHPNNNYDGLNLHNPAINLEYFDFPLPSHIDKSERISSAQVFSYLRDYCMMNNLYTRMRFNVEVMKVNYNTNSNKLELSCVDLNTQVEFVKDYDYVIYTNGFSNRIIPNFSTKEVFRGELYHSFEVNEEKLRLMVAHNKSILVVGGSKTATDFILSFYKYGYNVKWLYRENYWFLNRDPINSILKKKLLGKKAGYFYQKLYFFGQSLGARHPKLQYWVWRLFKIIHTYGVKHTNFKKYHQGVIDSKQMHILREYSNKCSVKGDIDSLVEQGIKLKDGRILSADCIIFCTGSGAVGSLIDISIDEKPFPINSIKKVYRSRVIPQIPGLIFTAFSSFGGNGVVNGLSFGNWISKYIENSLDSAALAKDVTTYNEPFFSSQFLFDSNGYMSSRSSMSLKPFFGSGELSEDYYKKWERDNLLSVKSTKPLEFNDPKLNSSPPS